MLDPGANGFSSPWLQRITVSPFFVSRGLSAPGVSVLAPAHAAASTAKGSGPSQNLTNTADLLRSADNASAYTARNGVAAKVHRAGHAIFCGSARAGRGRPARGEDASDDAGRAGRPTPSRIGAARADHLERSAAIDHPMGPAGLRKDHPCAHHQRAYEVFFRSFFRRAWKCG